MNLAEARSIHAIKENIRAAINHIEFVQMTDEC